MWLRIDDLAGLACFRTDYQLSVEILRDTIRATPSSFSGLTLKLTIILVSICFFLKTDLGIGQDCVVVKDTIIDLPHVLNETFQKYPLSSGKIGTSVSSRTIIKIEPVANGVIKIIQLAISFEESIDVPNNHPQEDPFDIGVAFFNETPGEIEDVEKTDATFKRVGFDNQNPIGNKSGYDVFLLTVDVLNEGWQVTAGESFYISIYATGSLPNEGAIVHMTNGQGKVFNPLEDCFFLGFFGGPFSGRTFWSIRDVRWSSCYSASDSWCPRRFKPRRLCRPFRRGSHLSNY